MFAVYRIPVCLGLVILTGAGGCEDKAASAAVMVPSGREVRLQEVITDVRGTEGAVARFRFVAPGLLPADSDAAGADMQALCDDYAVSRIDGMVPAPRQIVISLAAEAVPFGEASPEVTQFFEAYAIKNGICIWEVF